MPKISIVLPNYNYARYLDERIQSLLNQTYQDFELIIVDDASTDNSLETIDKYIADPRVKTIFYPNNSGSVYQRWNDGAEIATGEYLIFAGADDSCHPTSLVLKERLQVIHYISRRVDILESFWETAFDPTVFGWIRAIAYREIPLSSSRKIYRSLKELDPNINYRILTRLMDAVKRKILRSK
jgi:glycosyltransferase involved in cell wall biosynthesis